MTGPTAMIDMTWAGLFMTGPTIKRPKDTTAKPLVSKTCKDCGKEKLAKYFQTCGTHENGSKKYGSYCLPCMAIRNQEQRRKNRGLQG